MKTSGFVLGGALLLAGLEFCSVRAVRAQDSIILAPVDATKRSYSIRLRNVKPSVVAFWLDPQHQPRPEAFGPLTNEEATLQALAPDAKKSVFALPSGIERIVAVDPQNALLVLGTADAIAELRTTITFLDRSLRQVEIEAQFVRISTSDTAAFGIDFTIVGRGFTAGPQLSPPLPKGATGVQLGFVRGNFQASLAALQAANRAEIVSAPRVTAINNLTAKLGETSFSPAVIGIRNERGEFVPLLDSTEAAQKDVPALRVGVLRGFEVTPTINNDNTVTLLMSLSTTLQLQNGTQASVALGVPAGVQAVANVQDGGTIALGGFDSSFVAAFSAQEQAKTTVGETSFAAKFSALNQIPTTGNLFRSKTATDRELIVFVTARIVRREGEAVK